MIQIKYDSGIIPIGNITHFEFVTKKKFYTMFNGDFNTCQIEKINPKN